NKVIHGTSMTKNVYGMNCPGDRLNSSDANTTVTPHGTRLIPTVPTAATQRDRFCVSTSISLYFPANVRAGRITDMNSHPHAKATTNVEKLVDAINELVF